MMLRREALSNGALDTWAAFQDLRFFKPSRSSFKVAFLLRDLRAESILSANLRWMVVSSWSHGGTGPLFDVFFGL